MDPRTQAKSFLSGEALTFAQADDLWRQLERVDLSLARSVISRLREGLADDRGDILLDTEGATSARRRLLREKEALFTSKDPELGAAIKHDRAIAILRGDRDLDDPALDDDVETLGLAAGIYKRRWYELGQLADLRRAANYYQRAAKAPLGKDAYPHINAAFLEDLVASQGDDTAARQQRARELRERIVRDLEPIEDNWWNIGTLAEALFGLERYDEATELLARVKKRPVPWELEATARQIATLAELQNARSNGREDVHRFFDRLLGSATGGNSKSSSDARQCGVRSALVGKVGLALSGGGFRASFYHLGVLAALAERDVLRHVDVLSCVSGGSIVGACYWLALRKRLIEQAPLDRDAYVQMIKDLISHFQQAVGFDLRRGIQPWRVAIAYRVLKGQQGALDPEKVAIALERDFYRPLLSGSGPLYMHDLEMKPPEVPRDHSSEVTGHDGFNPAQDNWLRQDKVPVLVINATTLNTGHAWQFTPTWMGESPWAVHDAADAVPRLQWARYDSAQGWEITLGRAVAASACVPGVFAPLVLDAPYETDLNVRLVDGGVYDNQGTVSLLALNCNVLIVSDAAGQLMLEPHEGAGLAGLGQHAMRSMDTLMERIRQANFGDLSARRMSGLVRGMMFLHMKAGLDADPIRLSFVSEVSGKPPRGGLTPSGINREFQKALAELRTDLDAFSTEESEGLMACGYQMASKAFQRQLANLRELADPSAAPVNWPFDEMRSVITSTGGGPRRNEVLALLQAGKVVKT
jgi:predicted acylesterase/phospholipase RssA